MVRVGAKARLEPEQLPRGRYGTATCGRWKRQSATRQVHRGLVPFHSLSSSCSEGEPTTASNGPSYILPEMSHGAKIACIKSSHRV